MILIEKQNLNFSTLNNDVIPDEEFLKSLENYQPKVNCLL